jgi:hypothetical protein
MSSSIPRSEVKRFITYTVNKNIIRLSEQTSKAAGYHELSPDATPLVPAFAIALRREIFRDAEVLAESIRGPVEIQACDATHCWPVGRLSPSAAMRTAQAHVLASEEAEPETKRILTSVVAGSPCDKYGQGGHLTNCACPRTSVKPPPGENVADQTREYGYGDKPPGEGR